MLHLIWYTIIGFIAGFIGKSIMHVHLRLMWTIVLGIVGSLVGGSIVHLFSRPKEGSPIHPAGLVCSVLGSILILYAWHKLHLRIPAG